MFTCDLYNEDCIDRLICFVESGKKFDAIIADPPYNIGFTDWDKNFDIATVIELCSKLIKSTGNIILFQGYSEVCNVMQIMNNYFKLQNWIIWDRIKGRGTKTNLISTREDILWYSNSDTYTFNKIYSNIPKKTGGLGLKNGELNRGLSNVWTDISPIVPWSAEKNIHPTQKPVELMKRIVTIWTNVGDNVLDFTMGSGTTGVACKLLDRNFTGIEINKEYFDIAQRRIEHTNCLHKLF